MVKKISLKLIVLFIVATIGFSVVGCIDDKKGGVGDKAQSQSTIPKDYKTYVSKAGFSVTYPAEWYLVENRGAGWRIGPLGPAFNLYNPNDEKISMFFTSEDALVLLENINNWTNADAPKCPDEKMMFIIKNHLMKTINKIGSYEKKGVKYFEAYGIPRGLTKEQYVTFFYSNNNINIVQINSGQNSSEEALKIIKIEVFNE